jgi:CDP-paratose 2-epimerase
MGRNALVIGGAGFIGSNLVRCLLREGFTVIVFDAFCRHGANDNVAWLRSNCCGQVLHVVEQDVRNFEAVCDAMRNASIVYHLGAQVAVTTSVADPRTDFEINALGTINVLEAARLSANRPAVIFTSTNKVYGRLQGVEVIEERDRYRFAQLPEGIPENQPLDFYSPYGCSKGAADQYVRDYARIYGLPTVVFRMSCIYGPRQFGTEDQGWVAHFIASALKGEPLTVYGNGKQVRDILFIDDLVRALRLAAEKIQHVAGEVFNIGGGPSNTLSVWAEFQPLLEGIAESPIAVNFADWRPGDQPCYVSDIGKARELLGWHPFVDKETGIATLGAWIASHLDRFGAAAPVRAWAS